MPQLCAGVALVANASWSTKVTEEGHGGAASLHELHPEYYCQTLIYRAMVVSMRPLLTPSDDSKAFTKAIAKLKALRRKQPYRIVGRQAYAKDLWLQPNA